eukprot:995321-Amorphochlora_amoeboformis.AAC.1
MFLFRIWSSIVASKENLTGNSSPPTSTHNFDNIQVVFHSLGFLGYGEKDRKQIGESKDENGGSHGVMEHSQTFFEQEPRWFRCASRIRKRHGG